MRTMQGPNTTNFRTKQDQTQPFLEQCNRPTESSVCNSCNYNLIKEFWKNTIVNEAQKTVKRGKGNCMTNFGNCCKALIRGFFLFLCFCSLFFVSSSCRCCNYEIWQRLSNAEVGIESVSVRRESHVDNRAPIRISTLLSRISTFDIIIA